MYYPECFTDEKQFLEWRRLARASSYVGISSVCMDCTPEYKTKMILQDRCSEPEVTFERNEDGEFIGALPFERIQSIKAGRSKWGDGRRIFQIRPISTWKDQANDI